MRRCQISESPTIMSSESRESSECNSRRKISERKSMKTLRGRGRQLRKHFHQSRDQHVEERGVVGQARRCVDRAEGEERVAVGGQRREHEEHDKAVAAKNPADIDTD